MSWDDPPSLKVEPGFSEKCMNMMISLKGVGHLMKDAPIIL